MAAFPISAKDFRTPVVSYTPSMWEDTFSSFTLDNQVQEKYAKAIEVLSDEVRSMLTMAKGKRVSERLVLIDTLERLGVAYHFDQEIEQQLEEIFKSHCEQEQQDHDLFIASLQFRLLRQHHHHISCGVFEKFTGKDNKFKETLNNDAKGLLSLYEAAHLRVHDEHVLDEAVAFASHHLKRMVRQLECPLQDQIRRALELPLHRGSPRIEARYYISLYEKDNSKNETLLKLAKVDFNYVQNMNKKDLCELSRWWNDLKSQLPYARNRVVEAYLWGTAFHFKPQYSYVRMAVAKTIQMLTIVDDTYDNYATIEEADIFTEALQRWNADEIDRLPDYMKIIYKLILTVYEEYEIEAAKRGKSFSVPHAKETVKQLCTGYNLGLKWYMRAQTPSFEDYVTNLTIIGCLYAICAGTIPGMKSVSDETIDWLRSEPELAKASSKVCRYLDDVSGYERESANGQFLTGMDIYMKQYGTTIQETADKFLELAEDAWKDLNTEWMAVTNHGVPKDMLEQILGYARA